MNEQDLMQRLYNTVAVLTERLGGTVTITEAELGNPPNGKVTKYETSQKIVIETEPREVYHGKST